MNLGLPYKGSKNTIANDIVKAIPRGGKILDACAERAREKEKEPKRKSE